MAVVCTSIQEALDGIRDGASVMAGGNLCADDVLIHSKCSFSDLANEGVFFVVTSYVDCLFGVFLYRCVISYIYSVEFFLYS
jgi:hypothetical protein